MKAPTTMKCFTCPKYQEISMQSIFFATTTTILLYSTTATTMLLFSSTTTTAILLSKLRGQIKTYILPKPIGVKRALFQKSENVFKES